MKNNVDRQYFELVRHILNNGVKKSDRTGTGTISVFDYSMRFDMSEGFPLLTSKKMFTKGVIHELIWFLRGDTNIKYLVDNDVHIWDGDAYKNYLKNFVPPVCPPNLDVQPDFYEPMSKEMFIKSMQEKNSRGDEFAKKWGELGPVYGRQWRQWSTMGKGQEMNGLLSIEENMKMNSIDQIQNLINDLKNNPDSRRLMVSAWNVSDLDQMVLPPCHYGFQCYTQELTEIERKMSWCQSLDKSLHYAEDLSSAELDTLGIPKRKLSLKWTQRSCDLFLGVPFNIASYGLLLHLLAKEVNMVPGDLIFSGGDIHIYTNHIEQAKEQLTRQTFELPKLELTNTSIFELKYEDIKILNYQSDKALKAELSN